MGEIYTIKNAEMEVKINSIGAQLWSIEDGDKTQYLWQGDSKYWGDRAIHLFPYIARLTEGKYSLYGNEYAMDIHGFLKDLEMDIELLEEDRVVFFAEDSKDTQKQYPYHFVLRIEYALKSSSLDILYTVENKDAKKMFFGIGGHPGFNLPLEQGLSFADYYLEFTEETEAIRVGMSQDCFVTDDDIKMELSENKILPLKHSMFDDDAIILKNVSKEITLKSKKGGKGIKVSYPEMNYLGIWHMPRTEAPYICIEPWTSLPSRQGVVEALEAQKNLIELEENAVYINQWCIQLQNYD